MSILPESARWSLKSRSILVGLTLAAVLVAWVLASSYGVSVIAGSRGEFAAITTAQAALLALVLSGLFAAHYYRAGRRQNELNDALRRLRVDEITAIPNRNAVEQLLRHRCERSGAERGGFGVALINIVDLERVNASLGRNAGDRLLVTAARRLGRATRPDDLVARLEGNTFALVLRLPTDEDTASALCERAIAAFDVPVRLDGIDVKVDVRIGVGMAPIDGHTPDQLLDAAGRALRMGRLAGRNNTTSFASHDLDALTSLEVEGALRHALRRQELVAFYQPQLCTATNRIISAEALARWPTPEGRWVPPHEFIPVAETSGMIEELTALMIETAVSQIATWDAAGYQPINIGVNLSGSDLQGSRVLDALDRSLTAYNVSGTRLMLEVTESRFLEDPEAAIKILRRLRERRVRIAIDDFGTGYSSLGYLTRLPVDALKIDRTFVNTARAAPERRAVLDAICRMSEAIGLESIAEGVETANEAALARDLGCDALQGYLISPPLPADDFAARFLGSAEQVQLSLATNQVSRRLRPSS